MTAFFNISPSILYILKILAKIHFFNLDIGANFVLFVKLGYTCCLLEINFIKGQRMRIFFPKLNHSARKHTMFIDLFHQNINNLVSYLYFQINTTIVWSCDLRHIMRDICEERSGKIWILKNDLYSPNQRKFGIGQKCKWTFFLLFLFFYDALPHTQDIN